jgi:hypothetical protein
MVPWSLEKKQEREDSSSGGGQIAAMTADTFLNA